MIGADVGFNSQLHGGMPIMATEFRGQVGLSEMPRARGGWLDWSLLQVDWNALRDYGRAVARCVERYIDALSLAELELRVDMTPHGGILTGLEIYNVNGISHPRLHGGEIACLKGMQGAAGWEVDWTSGIESPLAVDMRS